MPQASTMAEFPSGIGFDARLSEHTNLGTNLDTRVLRFATPGLSDYSSATVEARLAKLDIGAYVRKGGAGDEVVIDVRGRAIPATVTKPPFVEVGVRAN